MISIICPIYNEERILSENPDEFQRLSRKAELIFVDGGSSDQSAEVARRYGKVIHSEKGRALQMNCGADFARGEILLFLHADNFITETCLDSIEKIVAKEDSVGGCLTQHIAKDGITYRFIERLGNLRARMTSVFYGDQGIFVRRELFLKMNGFPKVPVMEDVLFTRSLRRQGRTTVLADKIIVSPRRWEDKGLIRTSLLYIMICILFFLRFPLEGIKKLYGDLR